MRDDEAVLETLLRLVLQAEAVADEVEPEGKQTVRLEQRILEADEDEEKAPDEHVAPES